jgi:DNA topoisomerase-2
MVPMVPHFKGFKGKITKTKEHTWVMEGIVKKEGSQLVVSELPPGKWIQDFKERMDDLVDKGIIQKYENHSTETTPEFRIWGFAGDEVVSTLGLTKTIHTSNMYLIGPNGAVKKYASPEEILVDYIEIRLMTYRKRKSWLLNQLDLEVKWLSEKARFIGFVINKRIQVLNIPLEDIKAQLRTENFKEELWDKLLDIKTYQYTKEEVLKLKNLCDKRQEDWNTLKGTTVVQMWKNNISAL